jgi:hypothetical protein
VISRSSRDGARPDEATADRTVSASFASLNCRGGILTETGQRSVLGCCIARRRSQHPFADRRHPAYCLGQRYETGRGHRRSVRTGPPKQSFEARHGCGRKVDLRLVDKTEHLKRQRGAQGAFQAPARLHRVFHAWIEKIDDSCGRPVWPHRAPDRRSRCFGNIRARVAHGHAEAGSDIHRTPFDDVRPRQEVDEAARHAFRRHFVELRLHSDEFVAVEARNKALVRAQLYKAGADQSHSGAPPDGRADR